MNWIADRLRKQTDSKESGPQSVQRGYDSEARRLWSRFVQGFERDLDAYRQQKGNADLQRVSEFGCRVSNPAANTAVTPGTFAIASAFFSPSSVSIISTRTMLSLIVFR